MTERRNRPSRGDLVETPVSHSPTLDVVTGRALDKLVATVAAKFGGVHVALNFVTPDSLWWGTSTPGAARSQDAAATMCTQVVADGRPIILTDAAVTQDIEGHACVPDATGMRFYAGVPLFGEDGTTLGALCVWDERPRTPANTDIDFLVNSAREAALRMEMRQLWLRSKSDDDVLTAIARLLELIVTGTSLSVILDTLALAVEASMENTTCSILLLDGVILHHGAGPTLPSEYKNAIDGMRIGPSAGACGSAAYRGETVIVSDIAHDPLGVDYRDIALDAGLQACWSVPIKDAPGRVLGTFALYYRQISVPTADDLRRMSRWVNLAEIAINRAADISALHGAVTHDALTGLVNRAELERQLRIAPRNGEGIAIIFIDLDQFKLVNDTFGHAAGDELLRSVASRLLQFARSSDTVARFGGDEFVVLCRGVHDPTVARTLAQRFAGALQLPMAIYGDTLALSASIGIALQPSSSGVASSDLIGDADLAMYAAKRSGRNAVAIFDLEVRNQARRRLGLEADLGAALARNEIYCEYQPIVDISTGSIVAVETLMRWRSPSRGVVPPISFIETAEENGLIFALGEFVLRTACQQLVDWQAASSKWADVIIGVNVSPRQLQDREFVGIVKDALRQADLPAQHLGLEITEIAFVNDSVVARDNLVTLRHLGVQISIDDFGTGYSSLSQLKNLPVDVLKIDREFVTDVAIGTVDAGIVAAIVAMARTLALEVVAEGVETQAQRRRLQEVGCRVAQGYLWARPLDPANLAEFMVTSARRPPSSNSTSP